MPRNILCLLTDQHRVDTLGCYGNTRVRTPHLDRLSDRGTRFDRCYTPTAICTPARASLLTGAAPFRHKLLANYERNVGYPEDLPDGQYAFSDSLQAAGYNLGLVGKWHVGIRKSAHDFGFEGPQLDGWHNPVNHPDYVGYLAERGLPAYAISDQIRGTFPNGSPGNLLAARLQQPAEATFEHYLATRGIELLQTYADRWKADRRPFFLAIHFFGPHLPYILPGEYFDMYDPADAELPRSVQETFERKPPVQRHYSDHWTFDTLPEDTSRKLLAAYWGYVSLIDEQVGRLLEALHGLGLAGETAVLFGADHGEFTGAHRLHDKGPAMYEDIYRIPSIMRVPGMPSGQTRGELVSLLDYTATILDLADLDPSPAVDSRTLLPLVAGQTPPWPDDLVAEFHGHHFPYPQRMLRTARHKLVVNPESCNELYDLYLDPDELHNRYDDPDYTRIRRALLRRLYEVLRERGDNFYHWMTSMYDIGEKDYDTALSAFEARHHPAEHEHHR